MTFAVTESGRTVNDMRLIDADALMEREKINPFFISARGQGKSLFNACKSYLTVVVDGSPTIDAVPVVRCKDCKHFDMREMECQNDAVSTDHEGGASYSLNFYLDDYCSYGERKDGDG